MDGIQIYIAASQKSTLYHQSSILEHDFRIMKIQKRRSNFTPEEKVAILQERLIEGISLNELCDEHSIQPSQYYHWQKQLFINGTLVFKSGNNSQTKTLEQENARLRAKIIEKDEVIAEVIQEYVKLKKEI